MKRIALLCVLLTALFAVCALAPAAASAVTLYHHSTKQDLVNGGGSIGDSDKLEAFCKIKMVSDTGDRNLPLLFAALALASLAGMAALKKKTV